MSLNRSFWKGRRVFVTGHTGFKGPWLCLWLHQLGAEVTGYSLEAPSTPNLFEQTGAARFIRSIQGDVRDYTRLREAIHEAQPEVVLHLAAQSVVGTGYEDPIGTYSSNVMGTVHLLESVRQLGRPCAVVNVTSDKCYENREWLWGYRENDVMGGHDPYSNSKGCSELITSAFRNSYFQPEQLARHGVALASARAGNAVGGGDWTRDRLIPDLMRSFLSGRSCLIRNPSAYRPWQFVLEPLHGYLLLAERLSNGGAQYASGWNFGPADEDVWPVSVIADEAARLWGGSASWSLEAAARPHEAHALRLDHSKATAELGWRPALPLKQSLGWIIEWYRAYERKLDLHHITSEQIEKYEERIQSGAIAQMSLPA